MIWGTARDTIIPLPEVVIRTAVVYFALLILLRLAGRRQIAQMGPHELVAMLLVTNALSDAMTGAGSTLAGGLIGAAMILGMSKVITWLTYSNHTLSGFIQGRPIVLVDNGEFQYEAMAKVMLRKAQVAGALSQLGFYQINEVRRVTLDAEGRFIVTPTNARFWNEVDPEAYGESNCETDPAKDGELPCD